MQIVHGTSRTEKIAFTSKPDAATRRALAEAGWRYNGFHWWRNVNETVIRKPKELSALLAPIGEAGAVTA
ncbi:hypothetical protein [Tautonia rosea]|uniref:hypothetical protein n=1 Tax=Tautonia rosea TaxID=2728037 RepID=UPI001473608F|nr:hypothetical protein [Tautonia rosea]